LRDNWIVWYKPWPQSHPISTLAAFRVSMMCGIRVFSPDFNLTRLCPPVIREQAQGTNRFVSSKQPTVLGKMVYLSGEITSTSWARRFIHGDSRWCGEWRRWQFLLLRHQWRPLSQSLSLLLPNCTDQQSATMYDYTDWRLSWESGIGMWGSSGSLWRQLRITIAGLQGWTKALTISIKEAKC
jgi:hypothetical protein